MVFGLQQPSDAAAAPVPAPQLRSAVGRVIPGGRLGGCVTGGVMGSVKYTRKMGGKNGMNIFYATKDLDVFFP